MNSDNLEESSPEFEAAWKRVFNKPMDEWLVSRIVDKDSRIYCSLERIRIACERMDERLARISESQVVNAKWDYNRNDAVYGPVKRSDDFHPDRISLTGIRNMFVPSEDAPQPPSAA